MPSSSDSGKLYTGLMLGKLHEARPVAEVLDVGAGEGTYYKLLSGMLTGSRWTGVEVWAPYLQEFALCTFYQRVITADVRTLELEALPRFDLAICGDVLEHMTKQEAQHLIARLLERAGLVLISIPVGYAPQGEYLGNPYEAHVKDDWTHAEVLSSFPGIAGGLVHFNIGVYFLSADPERQRQVRQLQQIIPGVLRRQLPGDFLLAV